MASIDEVGSLKIRGRSTTTFRFEQALTGENMRNALFAMTLASLAGTTLSMSAPAAAQAAPAAPAAHYSVKDTPAGKLIDDTAAAAILKKMIPSVWANDQFQSVGRELTLKAIQQYEPEALSDENLAKIQAELDKIPAKP